MSRGWPRSLQGRLALGVLATVGAVWLGAALLTWRDVRHELDELQDAHLAQSAALLLARDFADAANPGRRDDGRQRDGDRKRDDDRKHDDERRHGDRHDRPQAADLHRYAGDVAFQVWQDGRLAMRSVDAPAEPMLAAADRARGGFRTVAIDGRDWRVFAARGPARELQVVVGERVESRRAILGSVLKGMLWPLALALPLLALAAAWAVRRGTRPLRQMSHTLALRRADDLAPLPAREAPSEVRAMVDALNGLFARIDTLMTGERRFTADAAHELRTPIAAIRAQAQVALGASDDAARRHALEATLQGCDRATRLVEQLLTLARLDAAPSSPTAATDLAAVARSVVGELAASAIARGQTIECEAAAPCPARADPTLAAVLVRNLVDNAVRYSPAGATVRVTVDPTAGRVRLAVEDSGPGLADADLTRLGERFFRVLGTDQPGSGLGWSIVRRIAQAQSAEVRVGRSGSLGGLRVEVEWPAAGRQSGCSGA